MLIQRKRLFYRLCETGAVQQVHRFLSATRGNNSNWLSQILAQDAVFDGENSLKTQKVTRHYDCFRDYRGQLSCDCARYLKGERYFGRQPQSCTYFLVPSLPLITTAAPFVPAGGWYCTYWVYPQQRIG
jgi:hypothetical protein